MIPIHQLLDRIRWDQAYGQGEFAVGYYDRVSRRIVVVPLRRSALEQRHLFFLELVDANGELHAVPLHRIRQVFRDGELIWERPGGVPAR